jgi:transposase
LAALARRRENLLDSFQQEKNRLDQPQMDKEVRASLTRQVRFLEKELARVEKALCEHVRRHAHLAADAKLLESVPGISAPTAQKILAELGDARGYASSGSAAAYAGLSPLNHTSGTSVKKKPRLTKRGNAHLREAMYFPTMTALTWNPRVKAFYERLVAAGKPKMVAQGAAMRKLLMIAVGVLRSGKPFDSNWPDKVVEAKQRPAAMAT